MNHLPRILVFVTCVIVAMFMLNSCGAKRLKKQFGSDVQHAVQTYGKHREAKQKIEKAIEELAEKHDIELGPDSIEVKASRTNADKTGMWQFVFVTAKVTYEHQILPFYKKKFTIIRSLHR